MCEILIINKGEKEIETPRQFQEHFGFLPAKSRVYNSIDPDLCLCQCDLDETFNAKGIEYAIRAGDYYVGQLDNSELFDLHFIPPGGQLGGQLDYSH